MTYIVRSLCRNYVLYIKIIIIPTNKKNVWEQKKKISLQCHVVHIVERKGENKGTNNGNRTK